MTLGRQIQFCAIPEIFRVYIYIYLKFGQVCINSQLQFYVSITPVISVVNLDEQHHCVQ